MCSGGIGFSSAPTMSGFVSPGYFGSSSLTSSGFLLLRLKLGSYMLTMIYDGIGVSPGLSDFVSPGI